MAQTNVGPDIWHPEFHMTEMKTIDYLETSYPAVPKHMVVDAYVCLCGVMPTVGTLFYDCP